MVMGKKRIKKGRVRWTVTDHGSPARYRVPTTLVPAAPAPGRGVDPDLALRAIEAAIKQSLIKKGVL